VSRRARASLRRDVELVLGRRIDGDAGGVLWAQLCVQRVVVEIRPLSAVKSVMSSLLHSNGLALRHRRCIRQPLQLGSLLIQVATCVADVMASGFLLVDLSVLLEDCMQQAKAAHSWLPRAVAVLLVHLPELVFRRFLDVPFAASGVLVAL